MEHQLPVLRAQSPDQLDRGVSGKYPFDHVAPHRPQPLATRESLAIITQPGFLYGALYDKAHRPVSHSYAGGADFPRRNNKGNVDATSRSPMYEIVALSARPEPARELGGARSARPLRRNFCQSDRSAPLCDVRERKPAARRAYDSGRLRIGHEPRRARQASTAAQRRMGSQATGRLGIGTTGNPARSG